MTDFNAGQRVRILHPEDDQLFGEVLRTQPMHDSLMVEVKISESAVMVVDSKFLEKVD